MTPEAEAHLLARLEAELLGIESQRARNAAEAHEIRDRAESFDAQYRTSETAHSKWGWSHEEQQQIA